LAIRFLDGVIDASPQPLQMITEATQRTRKVGLGIMGFADALIKMGVPYNSMRGLEHADCIMKYINDKAMEASIELGKEKGVFPAYEADKLGHARRNAIVTTIAPTGSISAIAGVSSGIEPIYAVAYTRKAFGDTELFEFQAELEQQLKQRNLYTKELAQAIADEHSGSIQDTTLPDDLKKVFVTAHDIPPEWHVRMQAQFQKYTGNSISKTINMKNEASVQEVDDAYMLSYQLGCKGVTVYRDGSKDVQVLTTNKHTTVGGDGHGPRARIEDPSGRTYEIPFGYGDALITVNEDDIGMCEVIIKAGKSGTPIAAESEELGRLISLLLRSGVAVKYIIKQMRGISAGEVAFYKGRTIMSLGDAVAYAMEAFLLRKNPTKGALGAKSARELIGEISYKQNCPDCGTVVIHAAKCIECPNPLCRWSKCK
jgi:ribonucleoside-diphosphate reductase alpha chain